MNFADYVLLGCVAMGCVLAVRSILRQKKRGGCIGCSGCCDACSHHCGGSSQTQPKN